MSAGLVTCTRPSTIAGALDKAGDGLFDYQTATVLQTILAHRDLHDRALLVDPSGEWRAYKPVVVEAKARRGKPEAGAGTAVHEAVSALLADRDVSRISGSVLSAASAVLDTLDANGYKIIDNERLVACLDTFPEPFAGTTDLVLAQGDRLLIGDVKTVAELGGERFSALKWATQVAVYASSRPCDEDYEPKRDQWGRPKIDVSRIQNGWDIPLDRQVGVIVEVERDTGRTRLHNVDLEVGAEAVSLACQVRALRRERVLV